jgi:hypothetical protein
MARACLALVVGAAASGAPGIRAAESPLVWSGSAATPEDASGTARWTARFLPTSPTGLIARRMGPLDSAISFAPPLAPALLPTYRLAGSPVAAHAVAALPANAGAGTVSGLPWASGASCDLPAFEAMRRRDADVYVEFLERSDWATVIRNAGNRANKYANRSRYPGRLVASVPMLTNSTRGQHKQCAAGAFDDEISAIARAFARKGLDDVVIRLGWEPNGDGNFPWSAHLTSTEMYKSCFRRQAMVIRSILPDASIDWTNRRGNGLRYPIDYIYPGDDFVDILGVMVYDRWPTHPNQASWDNAADLRDSYGGAKGLNSYLRMAKAHGKRLSVSEWGVSNNNNDPSSRDNPFFIEKMFEFFRDNASQIAYEAYFNCGSVVGHRSSGGYRLAPRTDNPRSRTRYRDLWGPAG